MTMLKPAYVRRVRPWLNPLLDLEQGRVLLRSGHRIAEANDPTLFLAMADVLEENVPRNAFSATDYHRVIRACRLTAEYLTLLKSRVAGTVSEFRSTDPDLTVFHRALLPGIDIRPGHATVGETSSRFLGAVVVGAVKMSPSGGDAVRLAAERHYGRFGYCGVRDRPVMPSAWNSHMIRRRSRAAAGENPYTVHVHPLRVLYELRRQIGT